MKYLIFGLFSLFVLILILLGLGLCKTAAMADRMQEKLFAEYLEKKNKEAEE